MVYQGLLRTQRPHQADCSVQSVHSPPQVRRGARNPCYDRSRVGPGVKQGLPMTKGSPFSLLLSFCKFFVSYNLQSSYNLLTRSDVPMHFDMIFKFCYMCTERRSKRDI